MPGCLHRAFEVITDVYRIATEAGGQPHHFQAVVQVTCAECHAPFEFVGLPAGLNLDGPGVSRNRREGRFAVVPIGSRSKRAGDKEQGREGEK